MKILAVCFRFVPLAVAVVSLNCSVLGNALLLRQLQRPSIPSFMQSTRLFAATDDLSSLPALVAKLPSVSGKARIDILNDLQMLAGVDLCYPIAEHFEAMGSKDLGLLPALTAVVSSSDEDTRIKVLNILYFLSFHSTTSIYMLSTELRLLPQLVSLITSYRGNSILIILERALDHYHSTRGKDASPVYDMYCENLGLLNSLSKAAMYSPLVSDNKRALCIILSLVEHSETEEHIVAMGSMNVGVLPALINALDKSDMMDGTNILDGLNRLSQASENRAYMGSPDLNLLETLVNSDCALNLGYYRNPEGCIYALNIVEYLSHEPANKIYMASPQLQLLSALKILISNLFHAGRLEVIETIANILDNLFEEPANRAYMVSEGLGLVSALQAIATPKKILMILERLSCDSTSDDDCGGRVPVREEKEEDDDKGDDVEEVDDNEEEEVDDEDDDDEEEEKEKEEEEEKEEVDDNEEEDEDEEKEDDKELKSQDQPVAEATNPLPAEIYPKIWEIITNYQKMESSYFFECFRKRVGLSRAEELHYLDRAMWDELATHLKPIAKRELAHIMAEHTNSSAPGK